MSTLKVDTITNTLGGNNITGVGIIKNFAYLEDQKVNTTNGGTLTGGTWNKRDLNTKVVDSSSMVTISNNEFTLNPGTYIIKVSAPAYYVNRHKIKLTNVSTGQDVAIGTSQYVKVETGNDIVTRSFLTCRVTISQARAFAVYHFVETTFATYGAGVATQDNVGTSSATYEVYTTVEIFQEI